MVLLEFRFICVLGGRQTPQDGLQGVDVLSGSRCGILGFTPASIVTLERCRRSCGGALSRNLHRGSLTHDALPIATDRPMGGRFPGDIPRVTFSCSRVNICQTLPPSLGGRLSTSHCG